MKNTYNLYYFIIAITFSSCASLNSNKSSNTSEYSEDITSYLPPDPIDSVEEVNNKLAPEITVDPTLEVSARIDSTLALVEEYNNQKISFIEGLSIQLYAGHDRAEAKEVQLKAYRYFFTSSPQIIFDQPNYKVRMGSFYSQLEAYPVYKSVKSKFPKAILVPIRIPVSQK